MIYSLMKENSIWYSLINQLIYSANSMVHPGNLRIAGPINRMNQLYFEKIIFLLHHFATLASSGDWTSNCLIRDPYGYEIAP